MDLDSETDKIYEIGKERLLMRAWFLRQVECGDIPGLTWHDKERTQIRVPWVHGSRQIWNKDKHSELFRRWAEYTGRYDPSQPNAKKWKANFRCALNSLPDVKEIPHLRNKGQDAYKVYLLDQPRRRQYIPTRKSSGTKRDRRRLPGRTMKNGTYVSHDHNSKEISGDCHVPPMLVPERDVLVDDSNCSGQQIAFGCTNNNTGTEQPIQGVDYSPIPVDRYSHDTTNSDFKMQIENRQKATRDCPNLEITCQEHRSTDMYIPYSDYSAADNPNSPVHSSSGSDSYTEDEYNIVTEFLLSQKDQIPQHLTGKLTELAELRPVIMSIAPSSSSNHNS